MELDQSTRNIILERYGEDARFVEDILKIARSYGDYEPDILEIVKVREGEGIFSCFQYHLRKEQ